MNAQHWGARLGARPHSGPEGDDRRIGEDGDGSADPRDHVVELRIGPVRHVELALRGRSPSPVPRIGWPAMPGRRRRPRAASAHGPPHATSSPTTRRLYPVSCRIAVRVCGTARPVVNGPLLPLADVLGAASQLHQIGRSCMVQHSRGFCGSFADISAVRCACSISTATAKALQSNGSSLNFTRARCSRPTCASRDPRLRSIL